MRQLLIVAVDTEDALDANFLALHVPRLIDKAKGSGEVLDGQFTPKQVKEAVQRCLMGLDNGEHNVSIFPELSKGEAIALGLRQLIEMVPTIEGLHEVVRSQNPRRVTREEVARAA